MKVQVALAASFVLCAPFLAARAAAQPPVRVVVVSDDGGDFTRFLSRFPMAVQRWRWEELESRPLDGVDGLYLLANTEEETLYKPARILTRQLASRLKSFVDKGGGFYAESVTPASITAQELFGFQRAPGIYPVRILKVTKPQARLEATRHWITAVFQDTQLWQVRATAYFDGQPFRDVDQVVLELAPAVGTYTIFRMAEGKRVPALIASAAAGGRGFYATLPFTKYLENGYGPRRAWEQLLERIALAPLPVEMRERLLEEKLFVEAWTEPRVWAPATGPPAKLKLVVECPRQAHLAVAGIPEIGLRWQTLSETRRQAELSLPPDDYRIRVEAALGGRRHEQELGLGIAAREQWYRRALDRNLTWFRTSGVLPAPAGSEGVLEGFDSLNSELREVIRADCAAEAGLTFYLYGRLRGDSVWQRAGQNVFAYLFRQGLQTTDKTRPTYGFWDWFEALTDYPQAFYTDDNGRVAYAVLRMYQLTKEREYLERGLATINAFLETQTVSGLRIARMEEADLLKNGRRWYAEHGKGDTDPHYVSFGDRAVLLAYEITGDKKYLDSARRSIDALAAVFPNFRKSELTRAAQFSRFLLSPALLYHYTKEEKYRDLFHTVLGELRKHQDETGAIAEWGSSARENFGGEGPVIVFDGEPITDQLYTINFALPSLHDTCIVLSDAGACDSFLRLADYLTRIQLQSRNPRLDGAWNRAFDFTNWEPYGNNSDPYWGPYSIESGWTNTNISIALLDYLAHNSAFSFGVRQALRKDQ